MISTYIENLESGETYGPYVLPQIPSDNSLLTIPEGKFFIGWSLWNVDERSLVSVHIAVTPRNDDR